MLLLQRRERLRKSCSQNNALDVFGMMVNIGFVQIPVDRKHLTDRFISCNDCHAVRHIDSKTSKRIHYPLSEDEDD